jgi:hypothetical protein
MAIVKVGEQNPINVAKFHKQFDNEFEYINHELIVWGSKDCVWWFIKFERTWLKKKYKKFVEKSMCSMGVGGN